MPNDFICVGCGISTLPELAAFRIAALMVIFVQLRKRHLPQGEDQAMSSVLPINQYPRRFAHSGKSQTVDFYSTLERCEKTRATWLLRVATLKWQVVITRRSVKMASGKLV